MNRKNRLTLALGIFGVLSISWLNHPASTRYEGMIILFDPYAGGALLSSFMPLLLNSIAFMIIIMYFYAVFRNIQAMEIYTFVRAGKRGVFQRQLIAAAKEALLICLIALLLLLLLRFRESIPLAEASLFLAILGLSLLFYAVLASLIVQQGRRSRELIFACVAVYMLAQILQERLPFLRYFFLYSRSLGQSRLPYMLSKILLLLVLTAISYHRYLRKDVLFSTKEPL